MNLEEVKWMAKGVMGKVKEVVEAVKEGGPGEEELRRQAELVEASYERLVGMLEIESCRRKHPGTKEETKAIVTAVGGAKGSLEVMWGKVIGRGKGDRLAGLVREALQKASDMMVVVEGGKRG